MNTMMQQEFLSSFDRRFGDNPQMFPMTPSLDEMARVAQGIPNFGPLPTLDEIHQDMT